MLLKIDKISMFWSGFFIGIFWFWWIGLSFRFYDLSYLIPFVIIGIGLIYGVVFRLIAIFGFPLYRALFIFLLSFFAPFGFNWLKPELTLLHSYFNTEYLSYALFLTALIIGLSAKKVYKLLAIIPLFLSTIQTDYIPPKETLKIKLSSLNIPQNIRWEERYLKFILAKNYGEIKTAIKENYDVVILPESAFPLYLNLNDKNLKILKTLSKKITIVTGALKFKENNFYNSSYLFEDGKLVKIADKVVLVPFGEEVPFPKFISDMVNKIFFDGAKDYTKEKNPQDLIIKGEKFRNAICYEATTDKIYEGDPKRVIAISNNAWFTPSTEPTLQKLLMQLYAKRYKTTIYHSANGGISSVIKP